MAEKTNSESTQEEQVMDNTAYIEAIKEMKEKTVSKEAYSKLQDENKKLLQSLINGETIEGTPQAEAADVNKLRNQLFGDGVELTNLEYCTKALELRDALIAEGKKDPFLPSGHKVIVTNEDVEAANRVAEIMKECIEYADGDSNIFTSELQRRMK